MKIAWKVPIAAFRRSPPPRRIGRTTSSHTSRVFGYGGETYATVVVGKNEGSPVAAVFKSGVKELKKVAPGEGADGIDNVHRALVRASNSEIAGFERHVGWLATTASAAPFVGLFGTVWGIMNSFQNIGATGAANLAVVAPGISEALITTATGIGAAIPAVIAYNHFAGQIKRLSVDMECFTQDFLNIIQRSIIGTRKGSS